MARSDTMSSYWRGARGGLAFLPVVFPFGMLFGVVATEAGLNLFETMSFSIVVIAGAAQFTALQLMMEQAPVWVVLASALAVNLRMAMYSASITPHLGAAPLRQRIFIAYLLVDQSYAQSLLEYEQRPKLTLSERVAYFFGSVTPVIPNWFLATLIGAWLGATIPASVGLDFALPLCFLALIGPMLRTGAHVVAALVAIVLALAFAWLPYNLGLMVGGLGGMMAGAQTELWQETKAAKARP